ncbi:MAG TPA: hypothetical protein VFJ30_12610 [Phycisphaerae bacterium]|nr:hypothetical protein [Phycisphaerae bacterium]
MKARLPWILLAVSVVFNAFFLVGFLRARLEAEKPRTFLEKAHRMAERLDLDQAQMAEFEHIVDEMERLRQQRAPEKDAFLAELTKENPDPKVLENYVASEAANEYRLNKLSLARKLVALLTPEQRQKLVELMQKRAAASK